MYNTESAPPLLFSGLLAALVVSFVAGLAALQLGLHRGTVAQFSNAEWCVFLVHGTSSRHPSMSTRSMFAIVTAVCRICSMPVTYALDTLALLYVLHTARVLTG